MPVRYNRRQLLKVGALGAGLTLSQYLRLHAENDLDAPKRSGIFIFMEGGPSHLDTFDLKPEAPIEIRGEFKPTSTNVPGVQICEHLPMLAQRASQYTVIRGISHNLADHGIGKKYLLTGNKPVPTVRYPEYGSVVSHEYPSANNLPSYVSIDEMFLGPGYLGSQYSPLTADKPRHGFPYSVRGVSLEDGLTVAKYSSQKRLLDDLDNAFQDFESLDEQVRAMDRFSEQAYDIISSPRTREAFDLSLEDSSEIDRFGKHEFGQTLLLAARLIEAGVHFVSVRLRPAEFDFDTHSENFSKLRTLLPPFDRGLSALLDRLDQRGLLNSTAILATGEFGRTPKINADGGRDHWARAMCALVAGGDIQCGQAIGDTDATAAEPTGAGFTPDDLAASFFKNIGIAPDTEFQTNVGRPITLIRDGSPIPGLFQE
ncbi:MAG: DUF1501 domain-containing protein [Pirellulales bacterium]|jgi:hypothetical protein